MLTVETSSREEKGEGILDTSVTERKNALARAGRWDGSRRVAVAPLLERRDAARSWPGTIKVALGLGGWRNLSLSFFLDDVKNAVMLFMGGRELELVQITNEWKVKGRRNDDDGEKLTLGLGRYKGNRKF